MPRSARRWLLVCAKERQEWGDALRSISIAIGFLLILASTESQAFGLRADDNVPPSAYPAYLTLSNQPLLELGYVDVTRPPYNADPTGRVDSRSAIQQAADDAYANNLVTFVPKGTYLLSGAIRSIQTKVEGTGTEIKPDGTLSQRKFARTLVGDNSGGTAPVLKLKDNASDLPENVFLYFAYEGTRYASARHYASLLRGFTIDMGNNPNASAVSMSAAQHSTIQDIEVIGNFDAGITGLPGSGGSTTNIHIKGGKIGIRQSEYRPSPSVHSVKLENQSLAGIELLDSRGPLVIVGFDIQGSGSNYRAVSVQRKTDPARPRRNLVLVDGKIELRSGAQIAIEANGKDIYLRNSFIKAPTLINNGDADDADRVLIGDAGKWLHIEDYLMTSAEGGAIAVAGGEIITNGDGNPASWGAQPKPVASPPSLLDRHRWNATNFPSIFETAFVDVRDYGASPSDASDDDSAAINAALRDSVRSGHRHFGKIVFLPRGHYHVRAPIEVPVNAKLIGASNTISVIEASTNWSPSGATALVRTANGVGSTIIANLAISGHEPSSTAGMTAHKHIILFHGRNSDMLLRDVQIARREYGEDSRGHYDQPVVRLSGNAGGQIFNLGLDHFHHPADQMAAGHRMLLIDGTRRPLHIYQPNIEGTGNTPQSEIRNSHNVYFYAFKYEGNEELLHINSSQNIDILGGSGNYDLGQGRRTIIDVNNSSEVTIANLARQGEDGDYAWLTNGSLSLSANRRNLALFSQDTPSSCEVADAAPLEAALEREKQRPAYSQDPPPKWIIDRINKIEFDLRALGCDVGPIDPPDGGECAIPGAAPLEAELAEAKLHPAYSRDPQPLWMMTRISNLELKLRQLGCDVGPVDPPDEGMCTAEGAASLEAELADAKRNPAYARDPQPQWIITRVANLETKLRNLGCDVGEDIPPDDGVCTIDGAAHFEAELADAKLHPAYSRDPQPDWMVTRINNLETKLRNLGCPI